MSHLHDLENAIAAKHGKSADELRDATLSELRCAAEKAHQAPVEFTNSFPLSGRAGNVLRHRLVTREQLDAEVDEMLR